MKHNRATSSSNDTADVIHRRALTAARVRRYRERQREASVLQLQQSEHVVQSSFDEVIAPTQQQVGFRIQDLTLPQAYNNIPTLANTFPVHEHHTMYHSRTTDQTNTTHSQHATDTTPTTLPIVQPTLPATQHTGQFLQWQLPPRPTTRSSPSHITRISTQFAGQGSEDQMFENDSDDNYDDDNNQFVDHHDNNDIHSDNHNESSFGVLDTQPTASPDPSRPITPRDWSPPSLRSPETSLRPASPQRPFLEGQESISDTESDSFYPQSEHSQYSLNVEEEGDPVSIVALQLANLFTNGLQGCTDSEHEAALNQHRYEHGNNHHGLSEVFNDPDFPSVIHRKSLLTPAQANQFPPIAPVQWRAMYCGISDQSQAGRPLQVCLHKEHTQASTPEIAFDVDSLLGFTTTLGFLKQGLWYQPAPQMRQNMTNNVHLETDNFRFGIQPNLDPLPYGSTTILRDVPHFLLGRVEGAHDITVHVMFPHIQFRGDKFQAFTNEQYTRWFDHIFHPAVYRHYHAHFLQHLPASFRTAFANTKARQTEGRLRESSSYQAQQTLGYHLQPYALIDVWADVLHTSSTYPGLQDFRDPQVYFSAKGTKAFFKSTPLQPLQLDVMDHFEIWLSTLIDMEYVDPDRFFVDLGKEICHSVSALIHQPLAFDEQPQIFLWKRCCLEKHAQNLYHGRPPAKGSRGQYYYSQNMLFDSGSLTSIPPKSSQLYQGGVRYLQVYGSVKEIYDAAKCFPFDNDGLEEMALDPQICAAARDAQRGQARNIQIIQTAYLKGKQRTSEGLQDAKHKSFGVREEYRVSWRLFQNIQAILRRSGPEGTALSLADCPSSVWAVHTDTYLSFLSRSVDKFATGFELVRALTRPELVTWEQTKMMAMFLRCLRYVLGGQGLPRESALWWSRRDRVVDEEHHVWYGLGFCNTLPRYGYCWLEPRIDWVRLQFLSTVTDHVLFGNNTMKGRYLRRGGHVRDFFALTRQLEIATQWIQLRGQSERVQSQLISWIVHICLQQFRIDILQAVKKEIKSEHRAQALLGKEPWSYEYFDEIFTDGVYLTTGNKSGIKETTQLRHCLFGFGPDDSWRRTHWESKPFRAMYSRADISLSSAFGVASPLYRSWTRRFTRILFSRHWILPHPGGGSLLQTSKDGGSRMWFSVMEQRRVDKNNVPLTGHRWEDEWEYVWARKDWGIGRPEPMPGFVSWSRSSWEEWIEEQGGILQ